MNLAQTQDDEPILLFTEWGEKEGNVVLLIEVSVVPNFDPYSHTTMNFNLWYLDNGANNHMTGRRSKFKDLDEGVTDQVKFSDGSTVKIERKGTITFKCKNDEERLLREVYFIATLHNNIVSLGQLSEVGNKMVLHSDYLFHPYTS